MNTACDDGGGGCELGLLFSLSLLLLLLPKMLSLEFRLVKTADFRAKKKHIHREIRGFRLNGDIRECFVRPVTGFRGSAPHLSIITT